MTINQYLLTDEPDGSPVYSSAADVAWLFRQPDSVDPATGFTQQRAIVCDGAGERTIAGDGSALLEALQDAGWPTAQLTLTDGTIIRAQGLDSLVPNGGVVRVQGLDTGGTAIYSRSGNVRYVTEDVATVVSLLTGGGGGGG